MSRNQRDSFPIPAPATYLLTWNPGKYQWLELTDTWEAVNLGYLQEDRWSCGRSRKPHIGDRVFMMCLGATTTKGIMASGWVTEEPFEDLHWNEEAQHLTTRYVWFRYDALLNPEVQPLLNPARVTANYNWTPQMSGLTIVPEVARGLETLWQVHLGKIGVEPMKQAALLDSDDMVQTYREGAKTQVTVNRYERDPQARSRCVEQRGTSCIVCGFNFANEFGEIGEGFIHVHHTIPLSERGNEYTVDPHLDLVPVCPNCHAMLHRKSPPYTIEELQQIRRQRS